MTQKYTSLEHSIRNIVESKEVTKPAISDEEKKKHNKLAQIKTKIIDEESIEEGALKTLAVGTAKLASSALKWGAIGAAGSAAFDYATDEKNRKDMYPDQKRKPDAQVNSPNEPGPDMRVGSGLLNPTVPKSAKGPEPRDYGAYVDTTKRKPKRISEEKASKVKDAVQKKKAEKTKGANPQVIFEPELKTIVDESAGALLGAAGKTFGKKVMPGVGAALGAYDAYQRAKKGDYVGSALSGAAGIASLIPGAGTGAAIGLTGVQLARDYKMKTGAFEPDEPEEKKSVSSPEPEEKKLEPPKAETPNDKAVNVNRTSKGDKKKIAESVLLLAFKQKYSKE